MILRAVQSSSDIFFTVEGNLVSKKKIIFFSIEIQCILYAVKCHYFLIRLTAVRFVNLLS